MEVTPKLSHDKLGNIEMFSSTDSVDKISRRMSRAISNASSVIARDVEDLKVYFTLKIKQK